MQSPFRNSNSPFFKEGRLLAVGNLENPFEAIFSSSYFAESANGGELEAQLSFLVRATLRAKKTAALLVDREGKVLWKSLPALKKAIHRHRYFADLDWIEEGDTLGHFEKMVDFLLASKEAQDFINRLSKPYYNPIGEEMIRLSLGLSSQDKVGDKEVRIAVLSALFSFLRQTIGSCFATAVALQVKEENPLNFLKDLEEILSKNSLSRIREGKEYIVPICISPGSGELKRPIFLDFSEGENIKKILTSPPFQAALLAANLTGNEGFKERRESYWTTAEKILDEILKQHFLVSNKEVEAKEQNIAPFVMGGVLVTREGKPRKDARNIDLYQKAKKRAHEAFFSFSSHALLRCWEYTLASFAETKEEFSSWNLYHSLGIDPKEVDGIGSEIQGILQEKLEVSKRKTEEFQVEYEFLFSQLNAVEARLRQASEEREMQWLRMEHMAKQGEFRSFEEMRNREVQRSERIAHLYNDIIDRALEEFPDFFQEVYDPDMDDVKAALFDDRPAGFRLIVKEGRRKESGWSKVEGPEPFGDALAKFFSTLETIISREERFLGLEKDLSEIFTSLILFLRSRRFLEASLYRMMRVHNQRIIKDPLNHLDKIEKKPWAYTSGGSLHNLVKSYYSRPEERLPEKERWVESETELALFLIDYMKSLDYKKSESFLKNPKKSLLMHSPTHAFLFCPGLFPFSSCWTSEQYSYTYLRDYHILPQERFYETNFMREAQLAYLTEALREKGNPGLKERLLLLPSLRGEVMNARQYARFIIENLSGNTTSYLDAEVASFLFSHLPLFPRKDFEEKMDALLSETAFQDCKGPLYGYEREALQQQDFISGKELIAFALARIVEKRKLISFPVDPLPTILERARSEEILPPAPLLFADTNWPGNYFAFLVSPVTSKLELWRTDRLGLFGTPMNDWKCWLDGSVKSPTWGILS